MSGKLDARLLLFLAVLSATGGCVLDSTPGIIDCQPAVLRYLWFGPSSGRLAIVPSVVAGARLDSAGWMTRAGTVDIGAEQHLVLAVRVRWSEPIVPGTLAVIYRGTAGMVPIVDDELGDPIFTTHDHPNMIDLSEDEATTRRRLEGIESRRLAAIAAKATRIEWSKSYSEGIMTGLTLPFHGCPRSAELVRKDEIAEFLAPDRLRSLRATLPSAPEDAGRLQSQPRVAWDSLIPGGFGGMSRTVIGFVVNPTPTLIHDARVALITERTSYADSAPPGGRIVRDSIVMPIGDLPPRSVVSFARGTLDSSTRIVERRVRGSENGATRPSTGAGRGGTIRKVR